MQAIYDSEARAIAIQLDGNAQQDRTNEVVPGAIAGLREGRIVEVELLGVGSGDDLRRLAHVSARYELDGQAIAAAFRAAVAAPDRQVTVTVTAPAACTSESRGRPPAQHDAPDCDDRFSDAPGLSTGTPRTGTPCWSRTRRSASRCARSCRSAR